MFLSIKTSGELVQTCSQTCWTVVGLDCPEYMSYSIASLSLSIGPAQTSREASGISQSIVELDNPGSIVCSVSLMIPSVGSAGASTVSSRISWSRVGLAGTVMIRGYTCLSGTVTIDVVPDITGEESLDDESDGISNPSFKYYSIHPFQHSYQTYHDICIHP